MNDLPPAPPIRIEIPFSDEPDIVNWVHDLFRTLLPRIPPKKLARDTFGDLETLKEGLEAERLAAKAFGFCVGLVGA